MGFAFLVPGAFSSAVATMAAQNIGAGRDDRARSSMKWGIIFSLICGGVICLLCQLIPELLVGIFSNDPAVIRSGTEYVRSYSVDCVLVSFVFCMNAYLNARGRSIICFAHSMAATFGVRIPVTWLMSRITAGSLTPMGIAAPAASLVSIVICLFYFGWMWSRDKRTA